MGGFFAFLSIDSKSAINLAFFRYLYQMLSEKLFWFISELFANFEAERERNGSETKNVSYNYSRIN